MLSLTRMMSISDRETTLPPGILPVTALGLGYVHQRPHILPRHSAVLALDLRPVELSA